MKNGNDETDFAGRHRTPWLEDHIMSPDHLQLYQRYEIDLGESVEIRQFAGVQPNIEGQMIFIFIPWVVDQNPERNWNQTLRITPELLYQVTLYQRV